MKIVDNLNEFIEKVDAMKKVNPLDLSKDQDLSIAIMNLISIEEHLAFSGAKTQDNSFFDLIKPIREDRKELLQKIIKTYKGEVWCISKHLLAASMRLMEVGTKLLGVDKKEEAYEFFNKSYDMYCLFWALNMNNAAESEGMLNNFEENNENKIVENKTEKVAYNDKKDDKKKEGFFSKLKGFITKNVNCCRE